MVVQTIRKTLKQNDTKTVLAFNLLNDADDTTIVLTNCTAKFQMKEFNATTLQVDGVMVINDPANGQCYYQFVTNDLDIPGAYNAEIEITYSDEKKLRTTDRLVIIVEPEVAAG